jgi:hypothetical protein
MIGARSASAASSMLKARTAPIAIRAMPTANSVAAAKRTAEPSASIELSAEHTRGVA